MKRFLLLFLGIMIATIAMAADVITKKNGTTIQCKVMKVGRTEVEYKNIINLDGPVYALDLTEIASITYENGAVDKFGEQSVVTTNAGQRTMTDKELMRMYGDRNQIGRGLKITGISLTGIGVVSLAIAGESTRGFGYWGDNMNKVVEATLTVIGVSGIIAGPTCYFLGRKKQKQFDRYACLPLLEQDFQLGNNTMLTADVNMINDNITHDKSLGLGLRFTF